MDIKLIVDTICTYNEIIKIDNLNNIDIICERLKINYKINFSKDAILLSIVQIYYHESKGKYSEYKDIRNEILKIKHFLDNEIYSEKDNKYKKATEDLKIIYNNNMAYRKDSEIYKKYYYIFSKKDLEIKDLLKIIIKKDNNLII